MDSVNKQVTKVGKQCCHVSTDDPNSLLIKLWIGTRYQMISIGTELIGLVPPPNIKEEKVWQNLNSEFKQYSTCFDHQNI